MIPSVFALNFSYLIPTETIYYNLGSGGAGGVDKSNGATGNTSTLSYSDLNFDISLTANGGNGGIYNGGTGAYGLGGTANGTKTSISTKDPTYSSYFVKSSSKYLKANSSYSSLFPTGTSSWTVEAFFYRTATGSFNSIVTKASIGAVQFSICVTPGDILFFVTSTRDFIYGTTPVTLNAWHHVAVVFDGGYGKMYLDGKLEKDLGSVTIPSYTNPLYIGAYDLSNPGYELYWDGYINNVRISNVARYTTTFVPSKVNFANDPNTIILTCQDTTFKDFSTNNVSIQNFNTVTTSNTITPFTSDYTIISANSSGGYGTAGVYEPPFGAGGAGGGINQHNGKDVGPYGDIGGDSYSWTGPLSDFYSLNVALTSANTGYNLGDGGGSGGNLFETKSGNPPGNNVIGAGGGGSGRYGGNGGAGALGGGGGGGAAGSYEGLSNFVGGNGGDGILVIRIDDSITEVITSGNTYSIPSGTSNVKVWLIGGGGGGAGAGSDWNYAGGGGGAAGIIYESWEY